MRISQATATDLSQTKLFAVTDSHRFDMCFRKFIIIRRFREVGPEPDGGFLGDPVGVAGRHSNE